MTTEQKKILFISAPVGAGHVRAAQAVANALQEVDPAIRTQQANVFDFFHPSLGQGILKLYLKLLATFPQAYGTMYGWGNDSSLALFGRRQVSRYLAKKMQRYILNYNPSAIVCTHATPAGLIAYLHRHSGLQVPTFAIVTDFVVHRLWVYPEISRYYVADETLRDFLDQQGIASERSRAFGIPVDASFSMNVTRNAILQRLNLPTDGKNILIMGGGAGILPMAEILIACDRLDAPVRFIAVTGNNHKLYNELSALAKRLAHPVRILGFVNNVHELMSCADILLSKPGGMTSAEALACGLPMIIFQPIPGQEEANTRFLVERNYALRADTIESVKMNLQRLLSASSQELENLRCNVAKAGKGLAAKDIAQNIILTTRNWKANS
ncbi:MAG: Monogalactosyldiacylglycerol synthase [Firmicutes bacterium]|nr:Monogalactosyldiacylglycerol synthase [Bacillota bacterium]